MLLREALIANRQWLTNSPVVIAGDFNSNAKWDKPRTQHHANLVTDLADLGLASIYHALNSRAHGEEQHHTFHFRWNPENAFHIDYIFIPHDGYVESHSFKSVNLHDGRDAVTIFHS
jgi:endonuclease/exonuclease/phosphatase family metal-dependent hydrolase